MYIALKRYYFLHIVVFFYMYSCPLLGQERLKKTEKDQDRFYWTNSGYYELSTDSLASFCRTHKARLVRRFSDNRYVIGFQDSAQIPHAIKGNLKKLGTAWKVSPALQQKLQKNGFDDTQSIKVSVKVAEADRFKSHLQEIAPGTLLHQQYKTTFAIEVRYQYISNLLKDPNVLFVQSLASASLETPVVLNDLSVNRIQKGQSVFPAIRGQGIVVSVKELLFNLDDIDLRNRTFLNGLEADITDQHANLIGTVIAGAGNTSSKGLGVASQARLTSSSFLRLLPDADENFIQDNISIQNHSYGTDIDNQYGNEAAAYDQSTYGLPQVVHVFSSGNDGNVAAPNGPYQGITGFSNQTGNFKAAKNIITVGATDALGRIFERSSKGPAFDGRLKPEMVAYAPGGTSDAAALVSGTSALLQQAYMSGTGQLPSAQLVRALLFVGTDDIGAEGIDFESGYGSLNAGQSLEILDREQFGEGIVSDSETENITLTVPEGVVQLRIAINWTDLPANPGDQIALVNDLDSKLLDPTGNEWLPWVLNTDPNIQSITQTAQRGQDHLNPTEYITLDNPPPGNYVLEVFGNAVQGQQSFAFAYAFEFLNTFNWTFPLSDSPLTNDQVNIVRWDHGFQNGIGMLEVNINEAGWTTLGENVDLAEGFPWEIGSIGGTAQLRMTIGQAQFLSEVFAISPELTPEVLFNCDTEAMIAWEPAPNAISYRVLVLGDRFMEPLGITESTSMVLDKEFLPSTVVRVEPIFFNGGFGVTGIAIDIQNQGVNCFFRNFFAIFENDEFVNCTLNLSTDIGVSSVVFEKQTDLGIQTIVELNAPFNGLGIEIRDRDLVEGNNTYSAVIFLEDGSQIRTDSTTIFLPGRDTLVLFPNPIPVGEDLNILSAGEALEYEIVSLTGQLVESGPIFSINDAIPIRLPTGIYVFRVLENNTVLRSQKIIVN